MPTPPAARKPTSCAACQGYDYTLCKCPWNKPFDDWPDPLLRRVKALIGRIPSHGS